MPKKEANTLHLRRSLFNNPSSNSLEGESMLCCFPSKCGAIFWQIELGMEGCTYTEGHASFQYDPIETLK